MLFISKNMHFNSSAASVDCTLSEKIREYVKQNEGTITGMTMDISELAYTHIGPESVIVSAYTIIMAIVLKHSMLRMSM